MLDTADILGATERLGAIIDGAVSAGNLKKGQSRDHVRRLQKTAERASEGATAAAQTVQRGGVADLQAFGISVVQVPRGAARGA